MFPLSAQLNKINARIDQEDADCSRNAIKRTAIK